MAGVYTSEKILKLFSTNKIHVKSDVIDGGIVDGLRQPILFSFVLDKLPGKRYFPNEKQGTIKK